MKIQADSYILINEINVRKSIKNNNLNNQKHLKDDLSREFNT